MESLAVWQAAQRNVPWWCSGEEYMDPKTEKWFLIILGIYVDFLAVFWLVWHTAATYMLTAMFLLGIIGWIIKIFFL